MKKRLRKKKHLGEFTEWGRQIVVLRNKKDSFDKFLDAFVEEAIEANGCYCAGGGNEDMLSMVLDLGRRSDDPDAKLERIIEWLETRTDVERWKIGDEFDLWYGDLQDIDGAIERQSSE